MGNKEGFVFSPKKDFIRDGMILYLLFFSRKISSYIFKFLFPFGFFGIYLPV